MIKSKILNIKINANIVLIILFRKRSLSFTVKLKPYINMNIMRRIGIR